MNKPVLRCAIYTRVSSDQGLEQDFNSLDAQREAAEAYVKSQAHEGWKLLRGYFDDGGYSGGSVERPALQRLMEFVKAERIDIIVVYKVDRPTRSLADFAKLVELFDAHKVSFVSVTQSFNTTTSMGRLTLNVLLSFAQFEREVTGERIRDKIEASKKKGLLDGWRRANGLSGRGPKAGRRRRGSQCRSANLRTLSGARLDPGPTERASRERRRHPLSEDGEWKDDRGRLADQRTTFLHSQELPLPWRDQSQGAALGQGSTRRSLTPIYSKPFRRSSTRTSTARPVRSPKAARCSSARSLMTVAIPCRRVTR